MIEIQRAKQGLFLSGISPVNKKKHTPPPYPKRPINQSAKFCLICGTEQRRMIDVVGPVHIDYCKSVEEKKPRRSGNLFWRIFGCGLVSPPNPPDPAAWYLERQNCRCFKCNTERLEKVFRKQYGVIGLIILRFKARRFPGYYSLNASK